MSSINRMLTVLEKKKPDKIMLDTSTSGIDFAEVAEIIKHNPDYRDIAIIKI